jgi:hypothetical protein
MNRRTFIKVSSVPLLIPSLVNAQEPTNNKSVVWIQLSGGASHIETFNPIPDAPEEFRSVTGFIETNVPGIRYGGGFRKLSRFADKISVVNSFAHNSNGHGSGTHEVLTTAINRDSDIANVQSEPSHGSVVSRNKGAIRNGMPTYITIDQGIGIRGASWLGNQYNNFNGLAGVDELTVSLDRFNSRRELLNTFSGADHFQNQAYDMLLGNVRDAFRKEREPEHVKRKYNYANSSFGRNMLLARRLVENGAGFVMVDIGGWDNHDKILDTMNIPMEHLDNILPVFMEDLIQRGLDRDTLIVITGEFGRTPRINAGGGRDHWPQLSTLAFALGGLNHGQIIGRSNARAEVPVTRPITPADLRATVFRHLEVPLNITYNNNGRPIHLCTGTPIL